MATTGFRNRPSSVTTITGSYNVPAGFYARVVANVEGSSDFRIAGSVVLRGAQNNVITSEGNMYRFTGVPQNFGAGHPGALPVYTSNNGGVSTSQLVYGNATDQKPLVHDYWVPSGTNLSGSGTWRAFVELYAE